MPTGTTTVLGRSDPDTFRAFMGNMPTGVTVVTTTSAAGAVGCTANAVTSLSLAPPSLLVCLATRSRTLAEIRDQGMFGLNILAWSQRDLSQRFATEPVERRFDGVEHATELGVPVLTRAVASAICAVREDIDLADHTLVVGAPLWYQSTQEGEPLLYHRQTYRRFATGW